MDIAVVGAGRVGTALAVLLRRAGHAIVGVSGRAATAERAARFLEGVPVLPPADAAKAATVVLVGVPDHRIAAVVADLASRGGFHRGQVVAHLSGATGLEVLEPARAAGALPLGLHPLQTFPSVEAGIERMAGVAFAVTADEEEGAEVVGMRLARDVGGRPFRLDEADKARYHAAAVFASNYLVAVIAQAEELFRLAGVPSPIEAMAPLARTSVENALSQGPAAALTGPIVRGDAETVERNLEALASSPDALRDYLALARMTLRLAEESERLPAEGAEAVEEVLSRWT